MGINNPFLNLSTNILEYLENSSSKQPPITDVST